MLKIDVDAAIPRASSAIEVRLEAPNLQSRRQAKRIDSILSGFL